MPAKKKKRVDYTPYFIHYIYCLILILLLTVAGVNFNNHLNSKKVLGTSTNVLPINNELVYWSKIIENNPTYTDGYLQLAKLNVELGNKKQAALLIKKASELNPNSSKIPEVVKILGL